MEFWDTYTVETKMFVLLEDLLYICNNTFRLSPVCTDRPTARTHMDAMLMVLCDIDCLWKREF